VPARSGAARTPPPAGSILRLARTIDMGLSRRIDTWAGLVLCALLFAVARIRARLGGLPQPALRATTPPRGDAPLPRPRRVLAIKLYGLGNVTMIVPVLDALRRGAPGVEIDFLSMEANRVLLERSGAVDRVLGVDVTGYGALLRSLASALRTIRRRRYDAVVDFEQFVKLSSLIGYLSGAPERIGFNTDGQRRGWLYTTRVVYTDGEHMRQIFLRLLRPFGIEPRLRLPSFTVRDEERARVASLLAGHGVAADHFPIVGIHVGSGPNFYELPLKRWPPERFAALADALAERHGAAVVVTGRGEEERALVDAVRAAMRRPPLDTCDRLGIGELLALLQACHLVVSNDTSVMHLAAAVGTPVVALFGPTSPQQYGPGSPDDLVFYRDLYCSPCLTNYNLKVSYCSDPVCLRSITSDQVLEAIEKRFLGADAELRRRARPGGGA
jgi:lipopolysaccharide heptosyltransferase II